MSRQHLIRVLALGTILSLPVGAVMDVPEVASAGDRVSSALSAPDHTSAAVDTVIRPAADLTKFRAGNIISDATFSDTSTMSASQIQSFFESKVPVCQAGYTCLKDWTDTSRTVAADAMCGAYSGVADERSSQIVYKVAQACGINPRVLLVMLQKEQGLVTHTWPSDWRYTIAMGQGCPDTAACDTRYYGFFNQVYGAAWQLKRYSNPPGTSAYFTWFAPGKTWNVRYNPDAACGSSPVLIENQATANLYYYTPYQPNAAALRAGYGEGDGCSAYGNRNFYNYFTDWFGSLQSAGVTLARTASSASVYLLSGSSRWHVADGDDYAELSKAFGSAAVVSDEFLAAYGVRGTTGAVLHDPSTGVMSLVQNGARHPLPTCELAARWGASCGAPTTVASSLLAKLPAGPAVGNYFRLRSSSMWGRFDSSTTVTPLFNEAAARAANGDMRATPFAAYLPNSRYAALTKAPLAFAPGQLVKSPTDARVLMTVDFDRLLAVNAWSDVVEYNRLPSDVAVVPESDLVRYQRNGTVAPTLKCPTGTYLLAGGVLHRLVVPDRAGMTATEAAEITCAQYPLGREISGAVAVRTADEATVFVIEQAQRRRAATWSHLVEANGGSAPVVLFVKSSTMQAFAYGPPIADGLLIKGGPPALALASGRDSYWLPSFDMAREVGIPTSYLTVTDAEMSALTAGPDLSLWLSCDGVPGFAASGRIHSVTQAAAAGFIPARLSAETCARLTSDAETLNRVFVKSNVSPAVYLADSGAFRPVATWAELVGLSGGEPKILVVAEATLRSLPGISG